MAGIKESIGWCDYTINPVKGKCPVACPYCYARRLYERFKWNPEVRYEDPFWQFHKLRSKPPSRVFIGSTMELFGPWIKPEWQHNIVSFCRAYPQHKFLFLTKRPQGIPDWLAWPDNCWVGISATDGSGFHFAEHWLKAIKAKVRYISLEPLLGRVDTNISWYEGKYLQTVFKENWIDWLIIGQQTPTTKNTEPKIEWLREIVEAADKAEIPVFLKDNLKPLLENEPLNPLYWDSICNDERGHERVSDDLRQELPIARNG